MNNVYSTSTNTSTDLENQIKRTAESIRVAKDIGARQETIETLEVTLLELKTKAINQEKYKDIRCITEWPDDVLIERYNVATSYAKKIEPELSDVDLFNSQEKEVPLERYQSALKLIEYLEKEGRKRDILYFFPKDKVLSICKKTFGEECTWVAPPTVANQGGQKK